MSTINSAELQSPDESLMIDNLYGLAVSPPGYAIAKTGLNTFINIPIGDIDIGGSNTQVQYNNNGVFGADSGFTYDNVSRSITLAGTVNSKFIKVFDGLASSPPISFTTDTATGIFHSGTGATSIIGFSVNGIEKARFNATGLSMGQITTPFSSSVLEIGGFSNTSVDAIAIRNEDSTTPGNVRFIMGVSANIGTNGTTIFTAYRDNVGAGAGNFGISVGPGSSFAPITQFYIAGNTGRTGIGNGTATPKARLQVTQGADTAYPTLGTAKGDLFLSGDTTLFGMFAGINTSDGNTWIQCMRTDSATAYNLLLQPVGGKVSIGTTTPKTNSLFHAAVTVTPSATVVNEVGDYAGTFVVGAAASTNLGDRVPLVFEVGNAAASNSISAVIEAGREASGWNTYLAFYTNNITSGPEGVDAIQEKVRITSDGNVGIGITAPARRLDVVSAAAATAAIRIYSVGLGVATMGILAGSSNVYISNTTAGDADFGVAGKSITLSTGGLVGIGTTAPTHALTFPVSSTGIAIYNTADQVTNYERVVMGWSGNIFNLNGTAGGTGVGRVIRITAGTSSNATFDFTANASTTVGYLSVSRSTSASNATFFSINGSPTATSGVIYGIASNLNFSGTSGSAALTALLVNPTIAGSTSTGSLLLQDWQVGGVSQASFSARQTIASATSATWDKFLFNGGSVMNITGATAITTANGFNYMTINAPTIVGDTATCNITTASMLYIAAGPTAGTNVTITNGYSLRVGGSARFDSQLLNIVTDVGTSGTKAFFSSTYTIAPTSGTRTFEPWQNTYSINQTGGANGPVTGIKLNATETAVVGTHNLMDLGTGGGSFVSKFKVDNAGNVTHAGRLNGTKGADVASANDITLGQGNYFVVTGTTQINRILGTNWASGSKVTLQFSASLTVTNGTAAGSSFFGFKLAGAANFSATADDTLTVMFDGAWWREIARTVI